MKATGRKKSKKDNISNKVDNNLSKNSIKRSAEYFFERKILFESFEKDFDIPAHPVEFGNFISGKTVNISTKSDFFAVTASK